MMTRRSTLVAFIVTVAVAVPAGWKWLDADLQRDGKRLRPLAQELTVDGVTVKLEVDRSIVLTGDSVTAKLVAVGAAQKHVTLDLYALHSSNYEGERVETPWTAIDHETLKLVAAPNGGPAVTTKIKLGERPKRAALIDSFRIYVQPHGNKLPAHEYGDGDDDDHKGMDALEEAHKAAAVSVTGWSGNNIGLQIAPRGRVTANEPFTIAVRVKNTTNKPLRIDSVDLTTDAALSARDEAGEDLDGERAAVKIEQVKDDDNNAGEDAALAPGKERVTLFTVTSRNLELKQITFLAKAYENFGLGPIGHGAMEARTFTFAKSKPSSVAAK